MASFAANRFAVRGRLVHATETPCVLEYVEDGLVVVDGGAIVAVAKDTPSVEALLRDGDPGVVVELAATDFLVPGLVDCHVHAAQYAYTGTATDKPLMEWLQHYTFPAERRCADVAYARRVYEKLVDRLLANGTTCSAMYATIHVAATKVLVDVCLEKGHRCVVGKVCMDRNGAEGYEETTAAALAGTEEVIEYVKARQPRAAPRTRVVQPCVVPRFIPTCTLPLLAGLGELAKKHDCWVQSHASETPDEMAFVESLHPGRSDSSIFDDAGLLTDKCVMAHCVYLDENELGLFAKRKCGVACCPLSNAVFSLSEGTNAFPLKRAHARGVPVGLGTDIAGGYATSMLSACRHAVVASRRSTRRGSPTSTTATPSGRRRSAARGPWASATRSAPSPSASSSTRARSNARPASTTRSPSASPTARPGSTSTSSSSSTSATTATSPPSSSRAASSRARSSLFLIRPLQLAAFLIAPQRMGAAPN